MIDSVVSKFPKAIFVTAVVVGSMVGACDSATSGPGAKSGGASHPLIGNPAPNVAGTAMNGSKGKVSMKDLKGKVVIVDFWGTFCEPCKKSFPKLQDLSTKYKSEGLEIIGVSEDDSDDKDKIPSFAETYGAKFPLVWDDGKAIAKAWDPIKTMPSSFVIDRKGVVRYAHVGYHDGEEAELDHEVKELLGK